MKGDNIKINRTVECDDIEEEELEKTRESMRDLKEDKNKIKPINIISSKFWF